LYGYLVEVVTEPQHETGFYGLSTRYSMQVGGQGADSANTEFLILHDIMTSASKVGVAADK
jgi:hypothetical protein